MKIVFTILLISLFTLCFSQPNPKFTDDLLDQPFDVQKFKKKKGQSNSGGGKESYFYKPPGKGVYWRFFLFRTRMDGIGELRALEQGISIVTFKPNGPYQESYFDPSEVLIQVATCFNDKDLPELAFIGLDTTAVKQKLGDHFLRKEGCFIYTKEKNVLVLKLKGKTVTWLNYVRLNSIPTLETIPPEVLKDPWTQ